MDEGGGGARPAVTFKVELGAIVLPSGIGPMDRGGGEHCTAFWLHRPLRVVAPSSFVKVTLECERQFGTVLKPPSAPLLPYLTHRAAEMVAISYVPTACFGPSFLSPCILVPFSVVRLGGIAARQGGTKSEHITPSMFGKRNFSPTR